MRIMPINDFVKLLEFQVEQTNSDGLVDIDLCKWIFDEYADILINVDGKVHKAEDKATYRDMEIKCNSGYDVPLVCEYNDFDVYQINEDYFVITDKDGMNLRYAKLVKKLDYSVFAVTSIADLLEMCDDYDYSGELDDGSGYCFWKLI